MRSTMILAAALLSAAHIHSEQPGDLKVHEWGTFTSIAGQDGAAIDWDALGGKGDLPAFVNDFGFGCFKLRLTGTVRMETPVIYFYSDREMTARVKVQFPHGLITEWYPNGDNAIYESKSLMDRIAPDSYPDDAVYQTSSLLATPALGLGGQLVKLSSSLNGIDMSLRNVMGSIGWGSIKVQPGSTAEPLAETRPSRYYAARGTDAAPITVGDQHEKFLFYRGVGRFAVPLSARLSDGGKVVVENRGADPVPSVILFENRGGRIGYRNAGTLQDVATLDPPSLDSSLEQLRYDLETALVAQGLYPKEAQAMVETWRDSWFEEGSRLIYVVPSHAIDSVLPLQIDPAPSQTSRVFVGRIELITSATKQAVEIAIAQNDRSTIESYRRFLAPILERISQDKPYLANMVAQFRRHLQSSNTGACR